MRIAIDTNRYRDFCAGVPEVVQLFRTVEEIDIPVVVLAELRAGFRCGTLARKNELVLYKFLSRERVRTLTVDEATTHHYANIYYQLRQQGTPIPTNDLWIAALVVQHNLLLCSRDEHFDNIPQVPRI